MCTDQPYLHFMCGKIASGKSTLAAQLGSQPGTVVISEDDWLEALYPDELQSLDDYVRCSSRLVGIMALHLEALLEAGVSVVLDFPANTRGQRRWLRNLVQSTGVRHTLHFLDVPDDKCLARLMARNETGQHPFQVTEAQFRKITGHFSAPELDEGFTIRRHGDAVE
ncbi:MAG: ATP-binding protein [Alphaproteobacteria bacterium]